MTAKPDLLAVASLFLSLAACRPAASPGVTDIGAVAPDIVGIDLDGGPLSLGEFAGKVVFLDFWGDW